MAEAVKESMQMWQAVQGFPMTQSKFPLRGLRCEIKSFCGIPLDMLEFLLAHALLHLMKRSGEVAEKMSEMFAYTLIRSLNNPLLNALAENDILDQDSVGQQQVACSS